MVGSPYLPESEDGFPDDLLDGGHSIPQLLQAGPAQRDHSFLQRPPSQLHRRCAAEDELSDLVRDLHHLVEPNAASVTRVVAVGTAAPLEELEGSDIVLRKPDVDQSLRG